jgi:ATP-dependent DNA helicase PIF1
MTMRQLINHTFPTLETNSDNLNDRVIVTPTNNLSDEINKIATNLMPGQLFNIRSYDKLMDDSSQAKYPTEFLNSLNISGLPPHELQLKIGLPVILLRNISPNNGLCNGTRLIIKQIYSRLIAAEITIGSHKGEVVLIPRMGLIPSDTDLPFVFSRVQFPMRPSFSMTINKAQGQTLEQVSLWLGDENVFSHGQLYVALSRVSAIDKIKIALNNENLFTRNVVYREIF